MREGAPENASVGTRRLAAIMFTDMVGFSRQMGADEARTLRLLAVHNQVIEQAVAAHQGHIIKTAGDGFLIEFPSTVHAVQCARAIQARFHAYNAEHAKAEQIHVRIGLHEGDILGQVTGDVLGDGVNVASRLQTYAAPDTICISQKVYDEVAKKIPLGTVISLGRPKLKNITPRFRVYALLVEEPQSLRRTLQIQRLKFFRRVGPVVLGLVSVLLLGGLVTFWFSSFSSFRTQEAQPPSLLLPDKPSIVVLPFNNMSKDPDQEYFSDGITEDITTGLAKISSLFVIARNSAFTYKGKAVKVQDISKEMGVQYILEGSVRRATDQIRITAQLIDGLTGSHVWAERYDRPPQDIFAIQDEIVQQIVTTLKLQLALIEKGFHQVRKRTDNLEAYDSYLRGLASLFRAFYGTKREENEHARQRFEKATHLDPHYADAYVALGRVSFLDWFYQWNTDPARSLGRAFELAQQAIALDDSLPGSYEILSTVYLWKKQHPQAIAAAERAIALDLNFAPGYANLGRSLAFAGRPEEGIESIEQAMRLDPRWAYYLTDLGWAYRVAGRYEEALVPLKKALTLTPNLVTAHVDLAACYVELGREEEARAEAAEVLRLVPHVSVEVFKKSLPYKEPADLDRFVAALRKAGLQ